MRFTLLMLLPLMFAGMPASVQSEPVFLQHRINDPLNLLIAVPAMSAPNTESVSFQVAVTHANVFSGGRRVQNDGQEEVLVLDGEISQLELRAQTPIGACYTAAFDSRLINHSGGFLDEEIDAWHQFFGLPDANRGNTGFDQLQYFYTINSASDTNVAEILANQAEFSSPGAALGDLWLSVQRPLLCQPGRGVAGKAANNTFGHVRLGIKLPVGNSNGWGAGGQSAVFADWHSEPKTFYSKARVTVSVGGSYSDDFDEQFQALEPNRLLGYGGVVFDYAWSPRLQSVLQFDFRSPGFDSVLTELGNWGAQVHLAIRSSFGPNHRFELSFSEDAAIDTAPDFGVRFAYTYVP